MSHKNFPVFVYIATQWERLTVEGAATKLSDECQGRESSWGYPGEGMRGRGTRGVSKAFQ